MGKKLDLFTPLVPDDKLHPSFKMVMEHRGYAPAQEIMREIFKSFVDPDGNFVEQFQSTGFDSRIWELYLYAYLINAGFLIDRSYPQPDFIARKSERTVCIEAVTANPTQVVKIASCIGSSDDMQEELDIISKIENEIPIKLGSALFSKLQKKYWECEHIRGKSLIFAIEDFHAPNSLKFSGSSLVDYLYRYRCNWEFDDDGTLIIKPESTESHKNGRKEIPSGFFYLPSAENISAVLFGNSGTIAKFNRMGFLKGYQTKGIKMVRNGLCYDHNPNSTMPILFSYEVGDTQFNEDWGEGLSMFHNSCALNPVSQELFPGIAHHKIKDGIIYSDIPTFHPFNSITYVLVSKRSDNSTDTIK